LTDTTPGITRAQAWREILAVFLKLGWTSFGGPIAHIGYYRQELVVRRRWLDEAGYADLVALCQFLPGPGSSQIGFALGLLRGGLVGALIAWTAFTMPSAMLLVAFAYSAEAFAGPLGQALIHGLKLVAVAVVAQAVWGMARTLCPDRRRAAIALGAVLLLVFVPSAWSQVAVIAGGALAGLALCRGAVTPAVGRLRFGVGRVWALAALALFGVLLFGLPLAVAVSRDPGLTLFEVFYRTGALVFGGGHVVLPLLEARLVAPGWLGADAFLAGYGAAQAIPGPLFTFSAYLGAVVEIGTSPLAGALICLIAIFLPGMLLLLGALPFWDGLRCRPSAQAAMAGANAAVVGLLGAALYDPVWTSAVLAPSDFALALAAFLLLTVWNVAPWLVVAATAVGAVAVSLV